MQIGCNDLQGADLSRLLLHDSVPKLSPVGPASMGNNVLTIHWWPTLSFSFVLPRWRNRAIRRWLC